MCKSIRPRRKLKHVLHLTGLPGSPQHSQPRDKSRSSAGKRSVCGLFTGVLIFDWFTQQVQLARKDKPTSDISHLQSPNNFLVCMLMKVHRRGTGPRSHLPYWKNEGCPSIGVFPSPVS